MVFSLPHRPPLKFENFQKQISETEARIFLGVAKIKGR
jgi:hypothetical protein